jgi:hypothetical protein
MVSVLYAVTALVTGAYSFYSLMNVVNGAPIGVSNFVALLGSAVLVVAATLVPYRRRVAMKIGLVGSALLWVFYLPAIVVWCSMPFSTSQEIRTNLSFHEYVPLAGMLLGPVLLTVCSVTGLRTIRATPD